MVPRQKKVYGVKKAEDSFERNLDKSR